MAASNRLFGAAGLDRRRYGSAGVRDADDIYSAANNNALALEAIEQHGDAFRIVIGERPGRLQHGHRTPQAAEGLRHFEADASGTDDDEMLRPFLEIENALVGKKGRRCRVPGIGGTAGADPVAITKRRARISTSPAITVLRSLNFAWSWMTRTPKAGEALGRIRRALRLR